MIETSCRAYPLIIGNWKMHGSLVRTEALARAIIQKLEPLSPLSFEVALLPPFVYLPVVHSTIASLASAIEPTIALGAQDIDRCANEGPVTGAVCGTMLKDVGCHYVLVGHSERRTLFQEGKHLIMFKYQVALFSGLQPILCIGETAVQRDKGQAKDVLREQIESILIPSLPDNHSFDDPLHYPMIIAYEPVWAIGSGVAADKEIVQEIHAFIREVVSHHDLDFAKTMRIIYGGSLNPKNAGELFAMPDVDGGLVGGASLCADDFVAICFEAAAQYKKVAHI